MRRYRLQILLLVLCILALSAGVVAGLVASRLPASERTAFTAPAVGVERSPLVEQLQLTVQQQEQMRQIWENVRDDVQDAFEQAERLQAEREAALIALLSDEQKAQFEKIAERYAQEFDTLAARRDLAFDEAVEQTKKLLNDEQRLKYGEILKMQVRRSPGGRGAQFPRPAPPTAATANRS